MSEHKSTKVALITGAGAGIGLQLTRRLLGEGWEVAALIRSGFAEEDSMIREAISKGKLRVYKAELTDFSQLRRVLNEVNSKEDHIDILFNNAGGSLPELRFSPQGREMHYELQTVVPYIVFMELKELLQKGALKTVVNTSSVALRHAKRFNPDELPRPAEFKKLTGPYATTKLALSLWTRELAAPMAAEGFRLISVDPGSNNTLRPTKNSGLPPAVKLLMRLFFSHPSQGANLLWDAAFKRSGHPSGSFVVKGRAADLPYAETGPKILSMMQMIYEQEFITVRN
ncbi:SDR family NAD(P)-dependent oxidoreductase [Paenibacillus medicaginis]|uniref:SDR family NAD(P)-dependent oxidoreductase n=1 Tax=Paenibacillus medicaginis TaxID=1470560 RepID=A0ABV5C4V3_9BACL